MILEIIVKPYEGNRIEIRRVREFILSAMGWEVVGRMLTVISNKDNNTGYFKIFIAISRSPAIIIAISRSPAIIIAICNIANILQ